MIGDPPIDETGAVLALANQAPKRGAVGALPAVMRELVGQRDAIDRVFELVVDIVGEHEMHPAPARGENRRLGIKVFEPNRDSRGVDDRLAVVERDRRYRYLSRREKQFFALEVVDLDHFELDALEREQLAHLGAERTAEKLVELRRHLRPLSAWSSKRVEYAVEIQIGNRFAHDVGRRELARRRHVA